MTKLKKAAYKGSQNSIDSACQIPAPLPSGLTADAVPMDFGSAKTEAMSCQETAGLFNYLFYCGFLYEVRVLFGVFLRFVAATFLTYPEVGPAAG